MSETVVLEYRVCGQSVSAGTWHGTWQTQGEWGEGRARAEAIAKVNLRVWIERRSVYTATTYFPREDVK